MKVKLETICNYLRYVSVKEYLVFLNIVMYFVTVITTYHILVLKLDIDVKNLVLWFAIGVVGGLLIIYSIYHTIINNSNFENRKQMDSSFRSLIPVYLSNKVNVNPEKDYYIVVLSKGVVAVKGEHVINDFANYSVGERILLKGSVSAMFTYENYEHAKTCYRLLKTARYGNVL